MMSRPTARRSNRPGFFIAIEGSDGSGKSTLARRLVVVLKQAGFKVCAVREPGGTRLSERVRRVLLNVRETISPRAELFLYLASRAQLVDDVIRPALQRGELVVADRFSLSTYAYQSAGRRLPLFQVAESDRFARDGIEPDLTIVLSVSEKDAEARLRRDGHSRDRIERESRPFHRRVRRFYNSWGARKAGHVVIDSSVDVDRVFVEALRLIKPKLVRLASERRRHK